MRLHKKYNYIIQKVTNTQFEVYGHNPSIKLSSCMKPLDLSKFSDDSFDEDGFMELKGNEKSVIAMLENLDTKVPDVPRSITTDIEMTTDGKIVIKGQEPTKKIVRPEGEISSDSMKDMLDTAAELPQVSHVNVDKDIADMDVDEINSLIKLRSGKVSRLRSREKALDRLNAIEAGE